METNTTANQTAVDGELACFAIHSQMSMRTWIQGGKSTVKGFPFSVLD